MPRPAPLGLGLVLGLLGLLGAPPASAQAAVLAAAEASEAAAAELSPDVLSEMASLRGSAEALVKKKGESLDAASQILLANFEKEVAPKVAAAEAQHQAALVGITKPAEASLAEAKSSLEYFRRDAALKGWKAAVRGATAVQTEAMLAGNALLVGAQKLKAEGEVSLEEIKKVNNAAAKAAHEASMWRGQWPKEQISRGIAHAKAANESAAQMHADAVEAEHEDTAIHNEALAVLFKIREAANFTKHAALVARDAVDQAAQNSAKLATITNIIKRAEAERLGTAQADVAAVVG